MPVSGNSQQFVLVADAGDAIELRECERDGLREVGVLLVDVGEHREEGAERGEREQLRGAVLPEGLCGEVEAVGRLRDGDERAGALLSLDRLGKGDVVLDADRVGLRRRHDVEQVFGRAVRGVEERVADAAFDLGVAGVVAEPAYAGNVRVRQFAAGNQALDLVDRDELADVAPGDGESVAVEGVAQGRRGCTSSTRRARR